MNYCNDFSRNLIKGGIAEMVFERMFAEAGGYLVVPFGYEKTVNILTQIDKDKEAFENLRSMPDYVLVDKNKDEAIYIVEVKYKRSVNYDYVKKEAESIKEKGWKKVWYFLATPKSFYFATCSDLIEDPKNLEKNKLPYSMVNEELQKRFLAMLNDFECDK